MVRGGAGLAVSGNSNPDGHRQCNNRGRRAGQRDGMDFAEGLPLHRDQRRAQAMRKPRSNDVEFADAAVAAPGDSLASIAMPY